MAEKSLARRRNPNADSDSDSSSDSDIMMLMMTMIIPVIFSMMFSSTQQPVAQQVKTQQYEGTLIAGSWTAYGNLQYWDFVAREPFTPLVSAFIINRGPANIYIAINSTTDWITMTPNETRSISHVGADKRIEMIFYKCTPGQSSTVEIEGHY